MVQARRHLDLEATARAIDVRPGPVPSAIGARGRGPALAHNLDAILPNLYDFACRLMGETAGAEKVVEAAVQRLLETPAALASASVSASSPCRRSIV